LLLSGGFVDPLMDDYSLILTAAAPMRMNLPILARHYSKKQQLGLTSLSPVLNMP